MAYVKVSDRDISQVNISLPLGIINEIDLNYVKACTMCQCTMKLAANSTDLILGELPLLLP